MYMWQKSIHIGLMLLVYLSSTSMMISKHYCSDQLKSTSFLTDAETCHDKDPARKSCPNHSPDQQEKKDCCSSEYNLIKTELNHDLYQPQLKNFQFSEIIPVLVFLLTEHEDFFPQSNIRVPDDWDPPSWSSVELPRIQRFLC